MNNNPAIDADFWMRLLVIVMVKQNLSPFDISLEDVQLADGHLLTAQQKDKVITLTLTKEQEVSSIVKP